MFIPSNLPTHDFIHDMTESLRYRLLRAGWNVTGTLFFEIPYVAISPINSGIIRDYFHKVYFRAFTATEGVIGYISDKELKIVIDHEAEELNSIEEIVKTGYTRYIKTSEEELRRHKPLIRRLYDKYGEEKVKKTLKRIYTIAEGNDLPLSKRITRFTLMFWLSIHMLRNFENYSSYAIRMTPPFTDITQMELVKKEWNQALDEYPPDKAPIRDYLELFKTLKKE